MIPMRIHLLLVSILFASTSALAQPPAAEASQVCLYVDNVSGMNPWMTDAHRERIRTKLTTVVNKSGTMHAGLGSFVLYPQVDIADVTVSDGGMKPITVAKLEAVINIARLDHLDAPLSKPGTVFNSMTMQLIGTGKDTAAAVNDAVGKIQASDPNIGKFLKETRERIMTYYQEHCTEVVNEGVRAYETESHGRRTLGQHGGTIPDVEQQQAIAAQVGACRLQGRQHIGISQLIAQHGEHH